MSAKNKKALSLSTEEEEPEEEYALNYIIEKMVFNNCTVHIENMMVGRPKDPPPPGNP